MDELEPTPVDATAVLRRAIEVDHHSFDGDLDQPLDRNTLAEIANEVGISPAAVAVAVAEAQAGALTQRSLLDRIVGPRLVSANRTVDLDDEETRQRVVEWLTVTHGLKPRVRPDGVVVAEKRHDLAGKLTTGIRRVQGLGGLSTANSVTAAAVAAGEEDGDRDGEPAGPGAVCVVADVGSKRKDAIVGGSAVAVSVSAAVSVVAVVTGPAVLVGIPVAAGVGTLIARKSYRTTVVKVRSSIDHAVDGVAQGEDPPRPRGSLAKRRRTDKSS
jgi:hypothetical protein